MPDVSVVIPTHDRRERLLRTLATVLGQENVALEVVVVDDGSSDDTPDAVAALRDPRVRVLRHERAQGVAAARNAGIAAATGRWIAPLDDDDLWSPRKLRRQLDAGEAAGAALVCSGVAVVDDSHRALAFQSPPDSADARTRLRAKNVVPGGASNAIAPAEAIRRAGPFDPRLMHFADWDLWARLAALGPVVAVPDVDVAYVLHGASLSRARTHRFRSELALVDARHGGAPLRDDDRTSLVDWMARNARGAGRPWYAAKLHLELALARREPHRAARAVEAVVRGSRLTAPARRVVGRSGGRPPEGQPGPAWLAELGLSERPPPPPGRPGRPA